MISKNTSASETSFGWSKSTNTIKWLFLLFSILINLTPNSAENQEVCSTLGCIEAAKKLLQRMDLNVNPCQDFYKFVCGKFINETVLPPSKNSISSFSIVSDLVNEQMRTLIDKPIEKSDPRHVVLLKHFYQTCMNTTEIEANSVSSFKRILKILGGWPVVEGQNNWNESLFNWISTTYELTTMGFNPQILFQLSVRTSVTNSSRKILELDEPATTLDQFMRKGFNESIVQSYYDYMVNIAIYFGADQEEAHEQMKEVIDFEIALTRITEPLEMRRNASLEHNPMTIKELEEKFTYVPWLEYINVKLQATKVMTLDDVITVTIPQYFNKLGDLIANTPKRVLSNYIFWKTVNNIVPFLNDEIRNLQLNFLTIVSGRKEHGPRWRECISKTRILYIASGALYVKHFFKKEAKQAVLELVDDVKNEFIEILSKTEWMDNITRQHALDKAKAISFHIAYPDELLDSDLVDAHYQNLTINPTNYLGVLLNMSLFSAQYSLKELDNPLGKNDWRKHAFAIITNAHYVPKENTIDFPAGILQDVFFDNSRPRYMNYGAIGTVAGHEITHGFDDKGRQFDKDGNLVNWWQPKTKEAFDAKAKCIIEQYGNITVPMINLKLNGVSSQGENIADNGAVKEAYFAYKKWVQKHVPELPLPGLPYTSEQVFWISAATVWCDVTRSKMIKFSIMSGVHSPSLYRVNVPFMNSEHFANDFNCPKGSPMNPDHKCVVW